MEKTQKRRIYTRRSEKFGQLAESLKKEEIAELEKVMLEERGNIDGEIYETIEEPETEAKTKLYEGRETKEVENVIPTDEEDDDGHPKRFLYLLIGFLIFSLVLFAGLKISTTGSAGEETAIEIADEEIPSNPMNPELRSMWLSSKEINEDYVGQIVFDSGLIDLPFVQAKSTIKEDGEPYRFYTADGTLVEDPYAYNGNDVYIWTSWKTGEYDRYEEGGSVFMDYRNYLKDQNIILYGHHFARDWDPEGKKQFTPLDVLLYEENYESNKNLRLILDNEIRSYVVTNVFTIDIEDDYESQIIRTDMNEDFSGNPEPRFFREYIDYMNRISRYNSGETLSDNDRILTLITCLEHQPRYRQIVVCKEVSDEIYDPV